MSDNTGGPQPEWDAERGEWVSGPYRWDGAAGQWVARDTAPAPTAAPVSEPEAPVTESVADVEPDVEPERTVSPEEAVTTEPAPSPEPSPEPAPHAEYAAPQTPQAPPSEYAAQAPQAEYAATQPPEAPQAAYPGQPTQPPYAGQIAQPAYAEAPPAAPRKKLSTGALIGIIAGGLVLVLAIVLGAVFAVRGVTSGGASASPEQVVTDYLTAIAEGDSTKALSYLEMAPDDLTLLTDDALAASSAAGEISDIVVTAPEVSRDDYRVSVLASYSIGGKPVSGTFDVVDFSSKGAWSIARGTVDIYLGDDVSGLEPSINGVPFDSDMATVFPGTIELAIDSPNYTLSGTTTTVVSDPDDFSAKFSVEVQLSEAGLTAFQTAVNDAVNECVSSKNLVAGCGIDLPETLSDGTKIIDGTVTRTLSASTQATLATLKPETIYGDPSQVYGPYLGGLSVTSDCEVNGERKTGCSFMFLPSLGSPLVDMTTTPPLVRWD